MKCLEYRPVRNRYQILCFAHPPGHDNLECRDIISVHVCGCAVAGETAPGPSSGNVQASSAQWLQEYLGSQWHWWVGVSDLLQCSVVTWGGSMSLAYCVGFCGGDIFTSSLCDLRFRSEILSQISFAFGSQICLEAVCVVWCESPSPFFSFL